MQMQEELSHLFAQNLSLHNAAYVDPTPTIHQTSPPEQAITYSITQHYHHSAHVVKRPASESSKTDQETTNIILSRHGVDVSTLFPSQIELFKSAGSDQQMRLVELWRISPPNYGGHALAQDLGTWPSTSFEQEEAMARLRYERSMMEERASRSHASDEHHLDPTEEMMSDGEISNAPLTPIQGGDGRWGDGVSSQSSEPYMTSGYDMLAQREYEASSHQPSKDIYSHFGTAIGGPSYQATDPVYKSVGDIHVYPNVKQAWMEDTQRQQQAMEDQYGMYSQLHGHGGCGGQDEEML